MSAIIQLAGLDHSSDLIRRGNLFISHHCNRFNTDIFQCRLLFKKTICMRGPEAAHVFYEKGNITQKDALPNSVVRLLQDHDSVVTLEGQEHIQRKQRLTQLLSENTVAELLDLTERNFLAEAELWSHQSEVRFVDALQFVLLKSICEWSGIPPCGPELELRRKEIQSMIDNAGTVGPSNWYATILRWRTEKWLSRLIHSVRKGQLKPAETTALYRIAFYTTPTGSLLPADTAAVELLNIIRPTVAVANLVQFAFIRLHQEPELVNRIANNPRYLQWFIQEVQRFYPALPFIAGIVQKPFTWRDYVFKTGTRVILDLYGTHHHRPTWIAPQKFIPERFRSWQTNTYPFIPQSDNNPQNPHRCVGEELTQLLMKTLIQLMLNRLQFDVKPGDYTIDHTSLPAAPVSPFLLHNIVMRGGDALR